MKRQKISSYLKPSIGERINYLYADMVCLIVGHKSSEKMDAVICYRCNTVLKSK